MIENIQYTALILLFVVVFVAYNYLDSISDYFIRFINAVCYFLGATVVIAAIIRIWL